MFVRNYKLLIKSRLDVNETSRSEFDLICLFND